MGMMYFQNALNYQLQDNCKPKAEKKKMQKAIHNPTTQRGIVEENILKNSERNKTFPLGRKKTFQRTTFRLRGNF